MPHTDDFYRWQQRVQDLLPDLRPHHRRSPAEYSSEWSWPDAAD